MKLEGKAAIVTGGGQGIGRAIALTFAREGADVFIGDINPETAGKVAGEVKTIGRKSGSIKVDVNKSNDVKEMIDAALREFKKIDILVNNAGGSAREKASEFNVSEESTWDFVLGRNIKGTMLCTREIINHMIERKGGKILNIGSVFGITGAAGHVDYSTSKGGVITFTRALAKEVGKYGINVNCISPCLIRTIASEIADKKGINEPFYARQAIRGMAEPQVIADAALFLVSEDSKFITGHNLPVDGGASL